MNQRRTPTVPSPKVVTLIVTVFTKLKTLCHGHTPWVLAYVIVVLDNASGLFLIFRNPDMKEVGFFCNILMVKVNNFYIIVHFRYVFMKELVTPEYLVDFEYITNPRFSPLCGSVSIFYNNGKEEVPLKHS